MLSAEAQGRTPRNISLTSRRPTRRIRLGFALRQLPFNPCRREPGWSETIFKKLEANAFSVRSVIQAYDETKGLFLADRY